MSTKTKIDFGNISSSGGTTTRDCAIDFTKALETSETISSFTVTSSDTNILSITASQINAAPITEDYKSTIEIGKGVQFRVAAIAEVEEREVTIDFDITGNSGTREIYEAVFTVVDKLRA